MEPYKNLSEKSGVIAFEIGADFVKVQYKNNPRIYLYSHRKINPHKIELMKELATSGRGLATYITQNRDVHDGFE